MWDPPSMSSMFFVASSLVSLRARSRHADTLGRVPTSYLPTSGLVDSLDARVDDPSLRRAVRRGDHFPLPSLVGETVANPKLDWEDLGVARCLRLVLLGGARPGHARLDVVGQFSPTIETTQ